MRKYKYFKIDLIMFLLFVVITGLVIFLNFTILNDSPDKPPITEKCISSDTLTVPLDTNEFKALNENEIYSEEQNDTSVNITQNKSIHDHYGVEIYGYMTLNEVAQKYKLTVNELSNIINIPSEYSDQRLGWLKKQYGFDLDELRKYVASHKK